MSSNRAKDTRSTAVLPYTSGLHERGAGFCNAVFLTPFPIEHRGSVLGACAVLFTSVGEVPLLGSLRAAICVSSFTRSAAGIVFITVRPVICRFPKTWT